MSATDELIRDWIIKADLDLKSAKVLLASDDELYGTACFHAQQLAEKSLKALLVARNISFSKTHNLLLLSDLLNDDDINGHSEALDKLTDHAVEMRYPGDYIEPELEEAEEALRLAIEIFELAKQKLGIL